MEYGTKLKSPIGEITIKADENAVFSITTSIDNQVYKESPLTKNAAAQLFEYFAGSRKNFDIPVIPKGTEFQKKVWKELCKVSYGETATYKELATQIGNEKASRAVGGALHNNPVLIMIPCHRIVGSNGSLTGFAGGLAVKDYLLLLEKNSN